MFVTKPGTLFLARVERSLLFLDRGVEEALQATRKKRNPTSRKFSQLITSRQLRALIAIFKTENFGLAAKLAGISQPSLRRAARDLELLLDITLFEIISGGVQLTKPGRHLVKNVKLSQAELDQGFVEIAEHKGIDVSNIVIGALPLVRTFVLPHAIIQFAKLRPNVQISIIDGPYEGLLHSLRHGEIDILIGALRDPLPVEDVEQESLFVDRLVIAARKDHPLAGKRDITLDDLTRYPWVVPRMGTPTRQHFEKLMSSSPCKPRPVETSSLVLGLGLLLQSDRLSLISGHQIRHEVDLNLLTVLPIKVNDTDRQIGLTLRNDWGPTKSQRIFLDVLRESGQAITDITDTQSKIFKLHSVG